MKRFAIYGASGCGRGIMPLARQQLQQSESCTWELVFVDDNPSSTAINGHRVLAFDQWLAETTDFRRISVAVANPNVRQRLVARCAARGVAFFDVVSENVVILDDVRIGTGAVLCSFVTLTSNIRIGSHFHANSYSYVEHDCVIGDCVTFAPGVHCNGNVVIEDHAYIGAGAILRQGKPGAPLIVGRGAIVGMGAVVTKDVPPGATVAGNPAKPLSSRIG